MRSPVLAPLLVLAGFVLSTTLASDAKQVLEQVRDASLNLDAAVEVEDLELDIGRGTLHLVAGKLIPAAEIEGRVMEMVFIGEARLQVAAPDEMEAQQIAIFTGQRDLDVTVTSAVIVAGSDATVSRLLGRPTSSTLGEPTGETATRLFDEWVKSPERRGFGAEVGSFFSLMGDAAFQNYFAAVFESESHGRFYYLFDPSELEQVTIGQFVPLDLDEVEAHRAKRAIRRAQRRGRAMQARLEDLGDWDTWMRSTLAAENGSSLAGSAGFEPTHYTIDATINPGDRTVSALATLDLEAVVGGRRAVSMSLFSDLKPTAVVDQAGRELFWIREGAALHVLLAEPVAAGDKVSVGVRYSGVLFDRMEKGIFRNLDTFGWYPRAGAFDRATYDVTLRRPKSIQLLGSGEIVESGEEAGLVVERRRLDIPAIAFTFEIGDFKILEAQVGHVKLKVGFSKVSLDQVTGAREEVVDALSKSLAFFEERFGPYPLDYLTVATIPRNFSQGGLGFLTLSHFLLARSGWVIVGEPIGDPGMQRKETVAHELAHQWWGNKVGWYNYRDQWLSEALAEYSAVLYMTDQAEHKAIYQARSVSGWKRSLTRAAADGRSIESLGPVVMGERLSSSRSNRAYDAIVYDKGSVVVGMLARMLGEEAMTQMLGTLASRVGNRAIDTDLFIRSIERMSGVDLTGFADRYIYGTGIPEIFYDYRFEENPDSGWVIRGQTTSLGAAAQRYVLTHSEQDIWDVAREHRGNQDVSDLTMVVPFQVQVESTEDSSKRKRGASAITARGLGGNVVVRAPTTVLEIQVPAKPIDFWLDQRGTVLATFFSERRAPKRVRRFRAMAMEGAEAEAVLQEALAAALVPESEVAEWKDRDLQESTEIENARIHLELARIRLDQGRAVEAQESFDLASDVFSGRRKNQYRGLRMALACRMDIRRKEYKSAFERLRGELRLSVPYDPEGGASNDFQRKRWREGRHGDAEDYALLAIAAYGIGNTKIAELALAEAEQQRVDMSQLKEAMKIPSGPGDPG